jgi:MYXO-CTERM domain-containing protein
MKTLKMLFLAGFFAGFADICFAGFNYTPSGPVGPTAIPPGWSAYGASSPDLSITAVGGSTALAMSISGSGYVDGLGSLNTHGIQQATTVGPVWTVSESLFITPGMASGAVPFQQDLGVNYAGDSVLIGLLSGTAEPFPPPVLAPGQAMFGVLDEGVWIPISIPVPADQWTTMSISFSGGAFDFGVDDTSAYVETDALAPSGPITVEADLQNFGVDSSASIGGISAISSVTVVPEPPSLALVSLAGLGVLAAIRRRPCRPRGYVEAAS